MHSLDHAVYLVWLATCLSHLADYHITVYLLIDIGVSFNTNEAVLFSVIEPMSCFACNYESVDLICFDPDQFIDSPVAPFDEALSSKFHSSASDP